MDREAIVMLFHKTPSYIKGFFFFFFGTDLVCFTLFLENKKRRNKNIEKRTIYYVSL